MKRHRTLSLRSFLAWRILAGIVLIVGAYYPLRAGVLLTEPGEYEVSGIYSGYREGCMELTVVRGTRSEHVVRIRWPKDPKILAGVKLSVGVSTRESGNPADLIFDPTEKGIVVLPFNADIYYKFWRRSEGEPEIPATSQLDT